MASKMIDNLNTRGFAQVECPLWPEQRAELISSMLADFSGEINALEDLHQVITCDEVNSYRLKQIALINASPEKIEKILEPFWTQVSEVIGQDCLRQKRINLVVHLPHDKSSVIPLHSDVKTGNSSFELGLWIPLTTCLTENTMWILPLDKWRESNRNFIHEVDDRFIPIVDDQMRPVFFKHFLPHGNNVNESSKTRVSLNIRFKGLFTPENKKSLLDYYSVWKMSEFTKQALSEWEEV